MTDEIITIAYLIVALALCRASFFLCVALWAICLIFINVSTDISAVYGFAGAGFGYILLSVRLARWQSFGAVAIAVYYFVFAADCWINSDVETWIWHNHEIIVAILHANIMLSFSAHYGAVVDACYGPVRRVYAMLLGNMQNLSGAQSRKNSE